MKVNFLNIAKKGEKDNSKYSQLAINSSIGSEQGRQNFFMFFIFYFFGFVLGLGINSRNRGEDLSHQSKKPYLLQAIFPKAMHYFSFLMILLQRLENW